jgi:PPOX class probable F420-dependent enzyme
MPQEMTPGRRQEFLTEGTRTAVLATARADGRPHAVPVWFAMDGDEVLISTGEDSVKGRAVQGDPRVTVVIDDETPPYAFVMIEGIAELVRDPDEVRRGADRIALRYLGPDDAAGFVSYATGPGKVLVRVRPTHVVAQDRVAG